MKTLKFGIEEFTVLNKKETEIVKKIIIEAIVAIEEQIECNNQAMQHWIDEHDTDATNLKARWDLIKINSRLEDARNNHKIFLQHLTES